MRSRTLLFFSAAALLSVALINCKSAVDPDKGRYTCETDADCGPDFECKKQAAGGSLCFKKGTCVAETCNGKDDDCDGVVDQTFPSKDMPCQSAKLGVCQAGKLSCVDAGQTCLSQTLPTGELCNGLDDDCNGRVDETFMLATDNSNCGICGKACPAGTSCQLGACREVDCADGIDNDGDGGIDCADPACQQRTCFTGGDAGFVCGKFPSQVDGGLDAGDFDGGAVDAGLDAGEVDAGFDAGVQDAGPYFCFPAEQCDDGIDNDQDSLTDCADPDCDNRTCVSGTLCANNVCPGPG